MRQKYLKLLKDQIDEIKKLVRSDDKMCLTAIVSLEYLLITLEKEREIGDKVGSNKSILANILINLHGTISETSEYEPALYSLIGTAVHYCDILEALR